MFGIKVLNHLHPLFLLLFARIEFRLEMENGRRKIRRKENIYMEASIQDTYMARLGIVWYGMVWYAIKASNTFLHAYACVLAKLFQQCME